MTMRKFRMVIRNQFSIFPWCAAAKAHSISSRTIARIFCMFMRNWKTWFFNSFLQFIPFLHFDSTSTTSKSQSKPIALFLSLCIWIIINFICFLQFDSSLLLSIYQKHTLKWLQNFIKLVSNSYKGNNMLIECFMHNYYSKDVKHMRIII